jgi:hypothetical protein
LLSVLHCPDGAESEIRRSSHLNLGEFAIQTLLTQNPTDRLL